jgi:hypothetical protein
VENNLQQRMNATPTHVSLEILTDHALRMLHGREREQVLGHLSECKRCALKAQQIAAGFKALRDDAAQPQDPKSLRLGMNRALSAMKQRRRGCRWPRWAISVPATVSRWFLRWRPCSSHARANRIDAK